jgi:hypothetical protein
MSRASSARLIEPLLIDHGIDIDHGADRRGETAEIIIGTATPL